MSLKAYRVWCEEEDCGWVRDGDNIRKLKAKLTEHVSEKHFEPSPHERRVARAIDSIIAALQDGGRTILPGTNLRPIAERIYQQAGRDVMEAWQSEMGEANRW